MNRITVKGRRVETAEEVKEVGDFYIRCGDQHREGSLIHYAPGMPHAVCLGITRDMIAGPGFWRWNGDRDKPTLSPSIEHAGVWHGHLTGGVFESC